MHINTLPLGPKHVPESLSNLFVSTQTYLYLYLEHFLEKSPETVKIVYTVHLILFDYYYFHIKYIYNSI
jgi:hypothetical protein